MLERPQPPEINYDDNVSLARAPDAKPNTDIEPVATSSLNNDDVSLARVTDSKQSTNNEPVATNSQQNPDHNPGVVAEVWNAISETFQDFLKICGEAFKAIGTFLSALTRFGGGSIAWAWANILKPVVLTLINVGAYFLDKILYGSPGLRPHLHDGLFGSEPPAGWRDFVRQNAGWDISSSTHPVLDNIFGVFGAGVGLLNAINHTLTSYCHHVGNYSHLLGTYGVFGERHTSEDKRNLPVQIGFGLLSMPGVIPTVILTNAADAFFTVCAHLAASWFRNQRPFWHLLGKHGVFGERYSYEDENGKVRRWKDDRGWPAIITYGIVSFPLVFSTTVVTNVTDAFFAFFKHFFLSYGRNIRSTFNLVLGNHGVMGERIPYKDDRHLITRLVFGAFSSPPGTCFRNSHQYY